MKKENNRSKVYPRLEAELKNSDFTNEYLAIMSGMTLTSMWRKRSGVTDFTVPEAIRIKQLLNSDLSIEELFYKNR